MKIALICLFLCVTQAFAIHTEAQNIAIELRTKNLTIEEFFKEVEKQTDYLVVYSTDNLRTSFNVTLENTKGKVTDLLDDALKGSGLKYEFTEKYIVLSADARTSGTTQQSNPIKGKVVDANGEPIIGANITVKGSSIGTITNIDGEFTLDAPKNAVLHISYIGYTAQEVTVGNKSNFEIILKEDTELLDEVVVVGYGTMKKSDLTGSVVKADLNMMKDAPNTSIMQSLHGSVAGLQIGQTNSTGEDPSIGVRGQTTINGSTDPLIILDGIIYNGRITDINPSDIASIDILKDASSKAVYGAKAANGVLMITSKTGKRAQKPKISYSGSFAFSSPTKNYRPLNREEWLQKVRDVEYEAAYTKESGYTEIDPSWDFSKSQLNVEQLAGVENGTDFNWWDEATQTGQLFTNVVSINGGGENVSYFLSGSWTDQQGVVKNDDYNRTTFRANVDVQATPWLKVGTNTFLSFLDYSGESPSMDALIRLPVVSAPKDENDEWIINPNGSLLKNPFLDYQSENSDKRHQINTTVYGLVTIPWVKGLTYRINYNYTLNAQNLYNYNKYDASLQGEASKRHVNRTAWLLDNIVNYSHTFGKHAVNATFVYGASRDTADSTTATGQQYVSTVTGYNSLGQAIIQKIASTAWQESNLYQMVRAAYNYDSKYLLTATLRRDGFSGFAQNHKFGLFPSVGLGWVLSREEFMSKADFVDNLKVRASFGVTGNQTARYSSLAKVSLNDASKYVFGDGGSTAIGSTITTMANKDLKWETTTEYNIGADFSFFGERLNGSVDVYRATTKNLLWDVTIPTMTGFSSVRSNVGELQNTGVEVVVGGTPVKTKDFQWNVRVNFAANKNEVVSLLGKDNDGDGKEDDLEASGLFIGESLGTIYDYEVEGIWQLADKENGTIMDGFYPGTYKIKDQNGDGKITPEEDRVILGHEEPAFTMGISNDFSYKGFNLRFFINTIQGGKNGYRSKISKPDYIGNSTGNAQNLSWLTAYDYWSPRNPDAKYATAWSSPTVDTNRLANRSFVRLQDVSLSYTFKKNWTQKFGVSNLRLFFSGQNLLTFTDWDGWDPEARIGFTTDSYPVMRSYSFGLDVTF